MLKKIRVIIVDDSALVREVLSRGLSMDPELTVVGTAPDPYKAERLIEKLDPDVMTLDVEMPGMNGVEYLKKLMKRHPLPVIMVSARTEKGSRITLEALSAGAIDFVLKPAADIAQGLNAMMDELREKIKVAARVIMRRKKYAIEKKNVTFPISWRPSRYNNIVIAIGASTGGNQAIQHILSAFPSNTPGVVIVQHMPAGFTRMFAERLNSFTRMEVKEAKTGDILTPGRVFIAPGNAHIRLQSLNGKYVILCDKSEPVCGHRPSVEVLFRSVAQVAGSRAIGIMLTGMGADGADGMVKMREAGARTVAQDETTSVVFGMPKEAYRRGGAEQLAPLEMIPVIVKAYLRSMNQ